jgi:hypothetical protein
LAVSSSNSFRALELRENDELSGQTFDNVVVARLDE